MQLSISNQYLHRMAIFFALIVVCLGAYTRLKHAGLGCPDWPKCFENWIVHANITSPALSSEASEKAWIEMIHRYAAGLLAIKIVGLRVITSILRKDTMILTATCIIVAIQAVFGMWTVTWRLHPLAVMPHLIGGMTITTLLCVDYCQKYSSVSAVNIPSSLHTHLQFLWLAILVQIIIGGWTSANYAALVCPDFPRCQGHWLTDATHFVQGFSWPIGHANYEGGVISGEGRIAIHITHRLGALILSLLMAKISWHIYQLRSQLPRSFIQTFAALSLCFIIQISLGILNVIWQLPITIAVGHNLIALFLMISASIMLSYRSQPSTLLKTYDTTIYSIS